ncbi:MAG: hypothetical protein ABSE51_01915 [Terracidiphilus sp.]|jgi:hypothetical protein
MSTLKAVRGRRDLLLPETGALEPDQRYRTNRFLPPGVEVKATFRHGNRMKCILQIISAVQLPSSWVVLSD